jgi:pimeloyl-ACP methyl ester carboxylesterase
MAARKTSAKKRTFDALPDVPDFRDRWFEPSLRPLQRELKVPKELIVLDQGEEGACTGFGLAAVVNRLHQLQGVPVRVSARMLYEMAKRYDEWRGESYEGSSCRGAIKGWYHTGVCREDLWPIDAKGGHLTVERAKDARAHTIGAYYRVQKNIVDMHAALNEAGVLYASASVHAGWSAVRKGVIPRRNEEEGGHAFAIVGYDQNGFYVQNSWGEDWGEHGVALWTYEDWFDNLSDAWVVQLALPTPQLYSRRSEAAETKDPSGRQGLELFGPRRDQIAGHFVHIDDGAFHETGRYWSTLDDVRETAALVAKSGDYDHLLFYAHGGLNSPKDAAVRIAATKEPCKRNRIYPYHFVYDTGLMEELKDVVLGKKTDVEERAGGFADWTDTLIERSARRAGRALWREMKADAAAAFARPKSPGTQVLEAFLRAAAQPGATKKRIHLVGHSTGAILIAHLLRALRDRGDALRIDSVSLLAPAGTVDLFRSHLLPVIGAAGVGVDRMVVYNLDDRLEQDDSVGLVYRKSLLYLVSRAFEETPPAPIFGMQTFSRELEDAKPGKLVFCYSDGTKGPRTRTAATSHGGFDNDPVTMNDVLTTVLGKKPGKPFTEDELDY